MVELKTHRRKFSIGGVSPSDRRGTPSPPKKKEPLAFSIPGMNHPFNHHYFCWGGEMSVFFGGGET